MTSDNDTSAQESKDFWADIVYNDDGSLNEDQVLRELNDFYYMIREVTEVYGSITNDRMTEPTYYARDVLSLHEELLEGLLQDARHDAVVQAMAMRDEGRSAIDVLKEFPPNE